MLRIVGVGDNVVDRYANCQKMFPGGNAVNFAVYGTRLGHEAAYVGLIADDVYGKLVERALIEERVDISHVVHIHGETGIGTIYRDKGDRTIVEDNDGGTPKKRPMKLDDNMLRFIATFDVAHMNVNGYMESELHKVREAGVPLVYDYSDFWRSEADLTSIAKDVDFAFFSGRGLPHGELRELLKAVSECGCELAMCTIGKKGAIIFDGKRYYEKQPYNLKGEVVDTLGAGDSFLTGFMTTYIEGKKMFAVQVGPDKACYCTTDDEQDYRASLIDYAMSVGNLTAIKNCMVLGAFGHEAKLV